MVPADGDELRGMLHLVQHTELKGPCAIRFPRATIPEPMTDEIEKIEWGKWKQLSSGGDTVVIATGTMVESAREAHELLKGEFEFTLINARFVKPLDLEKLESCKTDYKNILVAEENIAAGGLGQMIGSYLSKSGYSGNFETLAIPDIFVTHGKRELLLKDIGLDTDSLVDKIREIHSGQALFKKKMTLKKTEDKRVTAIVQNRSEKKVGK